MLLMGKSTISMAMASIANCLFTRPGILETRSPEAIIPNFHQNYLRIVLPSAMATISEAASPLGGKVPWVLAYFFWGKG